MKIFAFAAGAYLRLLRDNKDLGQRDVADFLDVSVRTIKRWERGENRPGVDYLSTLMEWLEGETDEFARLWEVKPGTLGDAERAIERTLGKRATQAVNHAADAYYEALNPEEIADIIGVAQRLSREDRTRWKEIGRRLPPRDGRQDDG